MGIWAWRALCPLTQFSLDQCGHRFKFMFSSNTQWKMRREEEREKKRQPHLRERGRERAGKEKINRTCHIKPTGLPSICLRPFRLHHANTQIGWLINNKRWFLTVLEAGESKIKMLTDLLSGEGPLLVQKWPSSHCLQVAEQQGPLWHLFKGH